MPANRFGGSFAPPLTLDKIAAYRDIAEDAVESNPQVSEIMLKLCDMVETFQETEPSDLPGKPHPSGRGVIVPLKDEEKKRIFDAVPWDYEVTAFAGVFDKLPTGTEESKEGKNRVVDQAAYDLRNAAFHLLWYAKELEQDREPITSDKL